MTHNEFLDWADKFNRDVFRLAKKKGRYHGRIMSDAELAARKLNRRLRPTRRGQS